MKLSVMAYFENILVPERCWLFTSRSLSVFNPSNFAMLYFHSFILKDIQRMKAKKPYLFVPLDVL